MPRTFGDVPTGDPVRDFSFAAQEEDIQRINYIAERLGCSKSEGARSAVRAYAAHLEAISRRTRGQN